MNNAPKITKGAIIRTIVLGIVLVNTILALFGVEALPIGEAEVEGVVNAIYAAITAVTLLVAAIAAWWKDNDFTKWARKNRKPKK